MYNLYNLFTRVHTLQTHKKLWLLLTVGRCSEVVTRLKFGPTIMVAVDKWSLFEGNR
jgi:hypothetical protein